MANYYAKCRANYFRVDSEGNHILKEFDHNTLGMVPLEEVKEARANGTLDTYIKTKEDDMYVIP